MSAMTYDRKDHGDQTVLVIRGNLNHDTVADLQPTIDALLAERRSNIELDLAGLELIDSEGTATIVRLYRGVHHDGGTVNIVGMRDQPRAIFKLLRMDKVFDLM